MFAAILLCGLTITMFTACGGDDEDTRPNSEQQGGDEGDDPAIPEATAYDITFTVVAPTNAFDITSYDFTYADSKITKEIDADMPNEPLSELEKNGLDMYIKTSSMTNSNFLNYFPTPAHSISPSRTFQQEARNNTNWSCIRAPSISQQRERPFRLRLQPSM